jgi:hypothetical protein
VFGNHRFEREAGVLEVCALDADDSFKTKACVVLLGQRLDCHENHRPAEAARGPSFVLAIDDRLRSEASGPVAPLVFLPDLPSPIGYLLFALRTISARFRAP